MVLASLVKLPVAVMVTFPAVPAVRSCHHRIRDRLVPILALLICCRWQGQRADIHRNVAGPACLGRAAVDLAPFERLTVPTFSTTSPPRPSLAVLVTIEPLSRVNLFAVMVTWPASEWLAWLEMLLPPEISTESASMVTFPPAAVVPGVPAWITAPSVRLTVLACTATSPARAMPRAIGDDAGTRS